MDLENIMLSEIHWRGKDKYHMISQVGSKKTNENRLIDTENKGGYQRGYAWECGIGKRD